MNTKTLLSAVSALLLTATLSAQEASLYTGIELHSPTKATFVADVYGIPNNLVVVIAGAPVAGFPSPFGTLYLDPASMIVLGNFTLDANGAGQLRIPFLLRYLLGGPLGVQAFAIAPGPRFAASKGDTLYLDADANFTWASSCVMNTKGCVKISLTGVAGTKIEIIHNDGSRTGNTPMWSATIPNPPRTSKSGLLCPPSWKLGDSIIIKVDGKVVRTIYR